MTEDELVNEFLVLAKSSFDGGEEEAHRAADIFLCDFLHTLGYHKITPAFDAISKWYA